MDLLRFKIIDFQHKCGCFRENSQVEMGSVPYQLSTNNTRVIYTLNSSNLDRKKNHAEEKSLFIKLFYELLKVFWFFYVIIFILFFSAARITTSQTSELGSHLAYMQKLLSIVRNKKQETAIDVTLKYTLSGRGIFQIFIKRSKLE